MDVATRQRSIGGLARFVARHRWASAALVVIGLAVGFWAWWATQLWGLPDVGDPFDVAAFEAEGSIPDERNAFIDYRIATSFLRAPESKIINRPDGHDLNTDPDGWAEAKPAWRDLLAQSGEALAAWRAGAEKPDARYDHPEGLSLRTLLPVSMGLRTLSRLAALEGVASRDRGECRGRLGLVSRGVAVEPAQRPARLPDRAADRQRHAHGGLEGPDPLGVQPEGRRPPAPPGAGRGDRHRRHDRPALRVAQDGVPGLHPVDGRPEPDRGPARLEGPRQPGRLVARTRGCPTGSSRRSRRRG